MKQAENGEAIDAECTLARNAKESLVKKLSVLILLLLSACAREAAPTPLSQKIAAGALIVDVRSPEETQSGMYPGALNIPIEESEKRIAEFGAKDRPVILYCRSGNRARKVKQMLESKGYTDVTNAGSLSDILAAKPGP